MTDRRARSAGRALVRYCADMRRAALVAPALLASLASCKSKPTAAPPPPAVADAATTTALVDAGSADSADPDEPSGGDEATLRTGKRTGLGAPDERPEVATEEFVGALLSGAQPWTRVVDPRFGVVELRTLDGDSKVVAASMGRQCGAAIEPALARLGKAASTALASTTFGYQLSCDNSGLVTPGGIAVATCSIDSDADGGYGFDLLLVPDATLGLRLIGITLLDATPPPSDIADSFDVELGRLDARC